MSLPSMVHQYYELLRSMPESAIIKRVKRGKIRETVEFDLLTLANSDAKSDYESRTWTNICCNPEVELINVKDKDLSIISHLRSQVFETPAISTSICHNCQLSRIVRAQEECCNLKTKSTMIASILLCPVLCCSCLFCSVGDPTTGFTCCTLSLLAILGVFSWSNPQLVCDPIRVNSIEEAKSLHGTLLMLESEIPRVMSCCDGPKRLSDDLMIRSLRFGIALRIEIILHKMMLDHDTDINEISEFWVKYKTNEDTEQEIKLRYRDSMMKDLESISVGSTLSDDNFIETVNFSSKTSTAKSIYFKNEISTMLATKYIGSGEKKKFHDIDFSASFEKQNLNGNVGSLLRNNFLRLGGRNMSIVPDLLRVCNCTIEEIFIVTNKSSRIKSTKSYNDHKDDDHMYDLFGIKYVVSSHSIFDCLSKSYLAAGNIRRNDINLYSMATCFSNKETSFLDFKIILVYLINHIQTICEIQIISSEVQVNDGLIGGHDFHKKDEKSVVIQQPGYSS
jgi:hypothetical protein